MKTIEQIDKKIDDINAEIDKLNKEIKECYEYQKINGYPITDNCDYIIIRKNEIKELNSKISLLCWVIS